MPLSETIKNRYGSKKGLLRYIAYEILRTLGVYRSLTNIDFTRVRRLVFICQGNICRSPLAEAVAHKKTVPAISYGLNTCGDDFADQRAMLWGKINGYDLSVHKTKRIEQYVPQKGDLLVGMEPRHIRQLKMKFSGDSVQITMLGLWLEKPKAYLHDPYNSRSEYFELCETLVAKSTVNLLNKMI